MKTNWHAYNRPPSTYIDPAQSVRTSALPGFQQQGAVPPYSGFAENLPVPYAAAAQAPAAAAGGGSSLNLGQLKGIVDRMGGIEGVIGTMTRVQKFMASFQQMAPMIKLLLGSFGRGAKAAAATADLGDYDGLPRVRKNKRRKRKPSSKYSSTKNVYRSAGVKRKKRR